MSLIPKRAILQNDIQHTSVDRIHEKSMRSSESNGAGKESRWNDDVQ